MAETLDKVAERLAQLEVSVAKGFHDSELRFSALNQKIDVNIEALRGDIQTVAATVIALTEEVRRTTAAIRKEHAADREVLRLTLLNHAGRIHTLEGGRRLRHAKRRHGSG